MANEDIPNGFSVVGRIGGGEPNIQEYEVDNGTGTAIFHGDLAKLETDGKAAVMAAASDDYIGVIVGILDADRVPVKTLAASTAGFVLVCDDPMARLNVQFEGDGTAPTIAAIGDCADAIFTHAGNSNTGRSGAELSETLAGDGNSAQFRIKQLVKTTNNEFGHNAVVEVVAKEHAYLSTPAAI